MATSNQNNLFGRATRLPTDTTGGPLVLGMSSTVDYIFGSRIPEGISGSGRTMAGIYTSTNATAKTTNKTIYKYR
jgi:hypothetical protein